MNERMNTDTKNTAELVNEHNRLFREPERMTVETIEDLLTREGFEPAEIAAAIVFTLRESRRSHPHGEFDKGGRWYPDEDAEMADCCYGIRSPSRAYPYSFMVHCRTIKHVASLYGVKPSRVRKAANAIGSKPNARHLQWVD